jgi:hypothetical protein
VVVGCDWLTAGHHSLGACCLHPSSHANPSVLYLQPHDAIANDLLTHNNNQVAVGSQDTVYYIQPITQAAL